MLWDCFNNLSLLFITIVLAPFHSMPSTTIFDQQSRDYKEKVVPNHVPKMIIEAGVTDHWWKYNPDVVLGIDKFGESAPEEDVFEAFGISSRTIVDSVLCLLGND